MIEKLKAVLSIPVYNDDDGFCWYAVEAEEIRAIIQRLEQVEVLREALEYVSESPLSGWVIAQGVARNALNQTKLP